MTGSSPSNPARHLVFRYTCAFLVCIWLGRECTMGSLSSVLFVRCSVRELDKNLEFAHY